MAPSGRGNKNQSTQIQSQSLKIRLQQLLQRSRETASSHSFYLYLSIYSIPPLCLFLFPAPNLCIYLSSILLPFFLSLHRHQQQIAHTMKEETWKLHASIMPSKPKSPHHPTQPSFSLINGPAGPKFMLKKEKQKRNKERKKEWENKKEREVRCVQMSSNQTHLTFLSLSSKLCSPNCPSASPQKIPSSSLVFQKNNIFHRVMWAFWISLSRSESSHRENRKARTFLPLHLFSLSWASLFLFLSFSHVSFHLPSPLTPPHPPSSFSLSPLFPLVFVCSSLLGSLVSL